MIDPLDGMTADMIMRGAQTWHCEHGIECTDKYNCWNAHTKHALRRYPLKFNNDLQKWELKYAAIMCRCAIRKRKCPMGKDCTFAHNCAELRFHPQNFRMQECKNDREPGEWCGRPFCTFYHNEAERRTGINDICFEDKDISLTCLRC